VPSDKKMAPFFYPFIFLYIFIKIIQLKIMKNIHIILFFSLLFPAISFSQGVFVTEETARTIAENFYFERIQSHRSAITDNIKVLNTFIVEENQVTLYYIFNISTGGFVAVSAYDATPPVLCYAFSGKYNPGNQPENFKAWMEQYKRQISYAISTKAKGSEEISALWYYYLETPYSSLKPFHGREILPLTHSTWDQGTYYNEMCPADPAGPADHCVTGCVATTLGQLMNYFRWPESGTGSYSYECPPYGTLSADFESANYQWDLMETSLNHSNPEVAELLFHAGVAVDMVYGPDGSGMYNHKGAYMLKTFFKYSPETQYVFRDSTSMDWDSLLVAHLDQDIPMYYAGWSVPDIMGHAFICDGYQGENYFHFNWGWSGSYDGYFYTDNLTPGGNMFNLAQELIINAVPDTNLYLYPPYCEGQKNFNSLFGTIEDGSGPLYAYQADGGCSWLITPNDSVNNIMLNFLQFRTDTNDFVTVYDGDSITAPVLGSFSGGDLPDPVSSTGNSMLVVFEGGPDVTDEGFLASFESEIPVYCNGVVMLSAQADTLTDGSGNWDYHNNSVCLWRIIPEGASSVTLYFSEFETEEGADMLKIYDLQSLELLAEYSGMYASGVPDPVTSPSGKIFLTFNSNISVTAPGWRAYFESDLVNVAEMKENVDFLIFPNPTDGLITIQFKNSSRTVVKLNLTDLSGRNVYNDDLRISGEKQIHLDLRQLSPGIYIMSSETGAEKVEYYKIIIH
jgi:hypothetical protein